MTRKNVNLAMMRALYLVKMEVESLRNG